MLGMVLLMLNSCAALKSPSVDSIPIPIEDVVIHSSFSPSVVFTDLPDGMGSGWGVGFVRPEDLSISPFDRPQTEEFRLSVGEKFTPYLILGSNLDKPMNVLVTVLLDYQQKSFELDGEAGILHKLEISPNVELNLPMNLAIDQTGAHDLIVIAFADPDYHPLDSETRLLQLQPALAGRRAVVVIGDNEYPFKELLPDMVGKPVPESNSDYLGVALAVLPNGRTDIPPADRQFTVTSVPRNGDFSFQVIAKNEDEEHVEYAMVIFLSFRLVSLDEDGVLLASLDPGEETTFDGTVHIPDIVGIHELQVVYILDPYKSILREEVTAPFVFGSVRVGLQAP
jgi:hypothetical protein